MARTASRLRFFLFIVVLVIVGGFVWMKYQDGTLPQWWAMMHPAPAGVPAGNAPAKPSAQGSANDSGPSNIFTGNNSSAPRDPAPSRTIDPAPAPSLPSPAPAPAVVLPAAPTQAEARANLDAVTATVERSLANDPAYAKAKADVTTADAKRQAALTESGPGSPQVQEASSDWVNAKARMKKVVDAAVANDPTGKVALREMKAAEAGARSGKATVVK